MKPNAMERFQRDIRYRCDKQEDGSILLSATLKDVFHDLLLEVTVEGDTLAISGARVTYGKCPSPDCDRAAPRLTRLVGTVIGKGMTRAVTDAMGGRDGCGNVKNLLLGLLPLALNVRASAGIEDEQEMLDTIHNQLLGSCAGYARPIEDIRKESGEM